eukprot:GHRR01030493.1.p1 GENE.GHRR01030493.1~~GHRR01030493.1.p1  ORF type:complete len:201 (+),score=46.81 GHRR01030493.1:675-1277(+)
MQSHIPRFHNGIELLGMIEATRLLPIGIASLDDMLLNGLRETSITEIAGETSSGKTQLCHLAAVTTAQRGERVIYFDTTNSFSATRANQFLATFPTNLPSEAALANITVVSCCSVFALLASLHELAVQAAASEQASWPKMVIIDSISALLSPVVGGLQHNQGGTKRFSSMTHCYRALVIGQDQATCCTAGDYSDQNIEPH